jgi:predicted transcriptional regulator
MAVILSDSPFKLAEALREKRGTRSKTEVAKIIGISVSTYTKLEDAGKRYCGNTSAFSQHLARYWVNNNESFY